MNMRMNGKLIERIWWPDSGTEQGRQLLSTDDCGLYMTATYHGDHDEYWVVQTNAEGAEVARHNPRFLEGWIWEEPIPPESN